MVRAFRAVGRAVCYIAWNYISAIRHAGVWNNGPLELFAVYQNPEGVFMLREIIITL